MKGFVPTQFDPDDLADLPPEEAAEVEQARRRLESCIRRCLGQGELTGVPGPRFRIATHRFLQALDHGLKQVCGHGLERFASGGTDVEICRENSREKVAGWIAQPARSLTIAADQQSCGPSGITFAQSGKNALLIDLVMDPPHRFWNCEKLGLVASGAWEVVLLTTVLYSISDGPFSSGGWFSQLNGARQDYVSLDRRETCPLFKKLLPQVARDCKRESEANSDAFSKEMWGQLSTKNKLLFKGPKPALSRWYSWADCHRHWSEVHHLRLLIFIIWGMGAGLLARSGKDDSLQLCSAPPPEPKPEEKVTMREAEAKAARLRGKGKNLLHVALKILQNPNIKRKADIVGQALAAMRSFHGDQIRECRTPDGNLKWSIGMADGSFVKPLADAWGLLNDKVRLYDCGFLTSANTCKECGYFEGEGLEELEASWTGWMVTLIAHLTKHRFRHLLFYTRGPGLLAALLSSQSEVRHRCLEALSAIWKGWSMCGDKPVPGEREARRKSWLARPLARLLLNRLHSLGWKEVPGDVIAIVRSSFSMVSTKLVEDAFQRLRFQEARGQAARTVLRGDIRGSEGTGDRNMMGRLAGCMDDGRHVQNCDANTHVVVMIVMAGGTVVVGMSNLAPPESKHTNTFIEEAFC